jgi:non-ribosomal peptide synthase protein (TIGR01720 family)
MVRAAFENQNGDGCAEISDVVFMKPMEVREAEQKELRLILEKEGDGFSFSFKSMSGSENGQSPWEEHVAGKIRKIDQRPEQTLNLEAIQQRCNVKEDSFGDQLPPILEKWEQEKLLIFGPRWKNLKRIHMGKNEAFAALELAKQFHDDVRDYKMHPALLDMAVSITSAYVISASGDKQNTDLYLPLLYKRLRYYAPFPDRFYSHVRYGSGVDMQSDNLTFDISLIDENGGLLAEIDGFTLRRVPQSVLRSKQRAVSEERRGAPVSGKEGSGPGSSKSSSLPLTLQGLGSEGILPAEGADAFTRILSGNKPSQVVVSTTDLGALIKNIQKMSRASIEQLSETAVPRAMHPRPNVQTAYVPPRTELEKALAEIWQAALGIDKVGIHDNFFELGADSVLGVQVISKARNIGIKLNPSQLFEYQTVAELATVAGEPASAPEIQISGDIPLAPAQQRLIEQAAGESLHREMRVFLVELPVRPEREAFEQAVRELVKRHDVLRMRYSVGTAGWRQELAAADGAAPFVHKDLSSVPESEQASSLDSVLADLRAVPDPAAQTAWRISLVDRGAQRPAYLLIALHPLAVDESSLRFLLDDLETLYRQRNSDKPSLKTASFTEWTGKLREFAQSDTVLRESEYWLAPARAEAGLRPQDRPDDATRGEAVESASVALSEAQTRQLLTEVPKAYNTTVEDVLMTALAQAFFRRTGNRSLVVDVTRDGRDGVFEDKDFSRTVGQLSVVFPVVVTLSKSLDPADMLKTVKEQLRSVPSGGIGYGALLYLSGNGELSSRLKAMPHAEVSFSHRGLHGYSPSASALFGKVHEASAPSASRDRSGRYSLTVTSEFVSGRLRADFTSRTDPRQKTTLDKTKRFFLESLQNLIAHCLSPNTGAYTPSDFPEANLNQKELDAFLGSIDL